MRIDDIKLGAEYTRVDTVQPERLRARAIEPRPGPWATRPIRQVIVDHLDDDGNVVPPGDPIPSEHGRQSLTGRAFPARDLEPYGPRAERWRKAREQSDAADAMADMVQDALDVAGVPYRSVRVSGRRAALGPEVYVALGDEGCRRLAELLRLGRGVA